LVVEQEFARILTNTERKDNILSEIIRCAFDDGALRILTRNNPLTASDTHVGIVGHITQDELTHRLKSTQTANGFANRFLYFNVERSKLLPEGATPPDREIRRIANVLRKSLLHRRPAGPLARDAAANERWHAEYERLSEGQTGLVGAVTSRAEVMVLRLSLIYALLDRSNEIRLPHLEGALAVWDYCEASAGIIFARSSGNPLAEKVLNLIDAKGESTTEIHKALGGHITSEDLQSALGYLEAAAQIRRQSLPTAGRKKDVWVRLAN
jgi:hypothetical protein